jgi:hypothetical protein
MKSEDEDMLTAERQLRRCRRTGGIGVSGRGGRRLMEFQAVRRSRMRASLGDTGAASGNNFNGHSFTSHGVADLARDSHF